MDINHKASVDNDVSSACSSDNDVLIEDEYQAEVPGLMRRDDYVSFNQGSGIVIHEPLKCVFSQKVRKKFNDEHGEGQRILRTQPVVDSAGMDDDSISSQKKDTELDPRNNSCCSAPSPNEWKDIECKSFLLGLYTFGKKLHLVKRFIGTRNMSDVLTYYYGKFYRSTEYIRWSQSRKMKGRGLKQKDEIYTGWRQDELLSRIFPHVSSDCKKLLKKVARRFRNGILSLKDYLFTLKHIVGLSLLVGAVAIGKENEDLTGTTFHREKGKQVSVTPNNPVGKAWTSPREDVKSLAVDRIVLSTSSALFGETEQGGPDTNIAAVKNHMDQKTSLLDDGPLMKARSQFQSHRSSDLEPMTKQNDPSKCSHREAIVEIIDVDEEEENFVSSSADRFMVQDFQSKVGKTFTTACKTEDSTRKAVLNKLCNNKELSTEKSESRTVIDLNQPYLSPESGTDEPLTYVHSSIYSPSRLTETNDHLELLNSSYNATGKENPVVNGQRKAMLSKLCNNKGLSTEKSESRTMIDLNQPYLSPESGTGEPLTYVHSSIYSPSRLTETNDHLELNSSYNATGKDKPFINGQRKSSRSRELTTKALEAISLDFTGPKKRRKGINSSSSVKDNVRSSIHCSSHLSETSDRLELFNSFNDETGKKQPAVKCSRQSSRNRQLTTKALEAIALDFSGPQERRKGVNSLSRSSSSRKVQQKTGAVISQIDVATYQNQEMANGDFNVDGEFPK